jgi:tetratricopeptide (TPR) repeat protein
VTTHNDFSGSADRVVQVGANHGDLIIQNLPAVPERPPVIPWQVPAPAAGFVNRTVEIGALKALLADPDEAPQIVVCSGLRGVGTTAMVRRMAHLLRERFPDGQLYVDYATLRHRGGAAVEDAIAGCLRDLGVDDSAVPLTMADRSRLFRTRTSGKSMMIVLDDVGEPSQVQALVPNGNGSVVLAASDALLAELILDGAHLMELEPLAVEDGLALLSGRCGPARVAGEPGAARQLVELCAGLPVALTVAAARLVSDRQLRIEDLVRELTDERHRMGAFTIRGQAVVAAVFETAYRHLPPSAALLYRRLGLLPGPDFSAELVTFLTGERGSSDGPRNGAAEVETLMAHGLVQRDALGRYRFHALVRLHAIQTAQSDSVEFGDGSADSALRAVIEYYLARAVQADHAVMGPRWRFTPGPDERAEPFADAASALAWLEVERPNLMASLRAAHERGWPHLVWQLAETMTALFYNQRHLADWYDSGILGAGAARECGRSDVESRLWMLTSRPMLDLSRVEEAGGALDRAEKLAEELGSDLLLGSVWEFRGIHLERVDLAAAILAYERSIEFKISAKRDRGVALSRFLLGSALDAAGRSEEAVSVLTQARQNLAELGDPRLAARAVAALGVAQAHLGQDEKAAELLEQAIAALAERRVWHYEAPALEELAGIRARLGREADARGCLERALAIHQMFGSARVEELQAQLDNDSSK